MPCTSLEEHLASTHATAGRTWPPPPPQPSAPRFPPVAKAAHLEHVCSWRRASANPFFVLPLPEQRALVADYGNGKLEVVCSLDGVELHSIELPSVAAPASGPGAEKRCRPLGLAMSPAGLYVVDGASASVLQLDMDGRHIGSFGGGAAARPDCSGSHDVELPLLEPYGCAFANPGFGLREDQPPPGAAPTEPLLYVVDSGRHRVVAFSAAGQVRFSFGEQGSGLGQLHDPRGVAAHAGCVWVADMCNHRVSVFSAHGEPRGAIGRHGSGARQLQYPSGVAVCQNLLLVSEYIGGRVSVLSMRGEFLQAIAPSPILTTLAPCASPMVQDAEARAGPGYLCAIGAARSTALVPDTNGSVHVFVVCRAGPPVEPPVEVGQPACGRPTHGGFRGQARGGLELDGAAGPSNLPVDPAERIGLALRAPDLHAMLDCLHPGDVHAVMPAVYADAAAHPERYAQLHQQHTTPPCEGAGTGEAYS
jgi:hypothetical protein